jgi:nicotinamidase-related amidase
MTGPDPSTSALIIVDMQNDFVHPDGGFAGCARENPERGWDMQFVMGTIPRVQRLLDAFQCGTASHTYHHNTRSSVCPRSGLIGGPD